MSDDGHDWEAVARKRLSGDLMNGYRDILEPAIMELNTAIEDGEGEAEAYETLSFKCGEFEEYAHSVVSDLGLDVDPPDELWPKE